MRVHTRPALPGTPVTGVAFDGPRRFYTLVQHRFASPPDWIGRRYLFLSFKGRGDRPGYRVMVDFDTPGGGSAAYDFRDVNPGWRVLVVRLWKPDQITGTLDWIASVGYASPETASRDTAQWHWEPLRYPSR